MQRIQELGSQERIQCWTPVVGSTRNPETPRDGHGRLAVGGAAMIYEMAAKSLNKV